MDVMTLVQFLFVLAIAPWELKIKIIEKTTW